MGNVQPGRGAVLTPGTHTGHTWSGRAIGSCGACGAGIATDSDQTRGKCPHCGARVRLHLVYGEHSDIPCDSRCMGAVGPSCSCGCGGANHGRWFIRIEMVPVFERDQARAAQAKRTTGHAARRDAKRAAERAAADTRRAAMLAEHPELSAIMGDGYADTDNRFAADIRDALTAGRELSPRQLTAAVDMVRRDQARAARRATRDQADADARARGVQVPTGRVTVSGVITSVKESTDCYGYRERTTHKIVIQTAGGWRAYGTLPRSVYPGAYTGETIGRWLDSLTGRVITLRATVKPSDNDQLFGYFNRPTGATLGPVPDGKPAPMCERCGAPPHADGQRCYLPGVGYVDQADAPADVDQAPRYVHVPDTGMWAGPMTAGEAHALAAGWVAAGHSATVYPGHTKWTRHGRGTSTVDVIAAEWQRARDAADRERYGDPGADPIAAGGAPVPAAPAADQADPPADPPAAVSVDQAPAADPFTSAWSALAAPADTPADPAPFRSAWSL